MSVKVIARVRPLLNAELDKDVVVQPEKSSDAKTSKQPNNIIRIPNPKNDAESFTFRFNSVYDRDATQQDIFENEISQTVKPLFRGIDVHIFAYGVTGSGKTHTVRGGKTLAERGIIPRLLSAIYRRARKIEKDSEGKTGVEVSLSYYEIYNDKVFDLFEPLEKRPPAGLSIRDVGGGKTIVAGLTERPCESLKEFESLYDEANLRRSTSATKLNAHSSRSHAILCVNLSQNFSEHTITSTVSAIDLAGSEDNRRTDNDKERLVESSSINKSLFVLAQCVEAIGKKQARIPFRESKMTRILSLGQNNGLTIMILNLAPVRSFQLDTLSTLQVANRTKKIAVREVENEPIFKSTVKNSAPATISGRPIQRQPLRPIPQLTETGLDTNVNATKSKPIKSFSVYAEQHPRPNRWSYGRPIPSSLNHPSKNARSSDETVFGAKRPSAKIPFASTPSVSHANIEELVNRMVDEKLASKTLQHTPTSRPPPSLDKEVQRRLEALEHRVEAKEDARAEGLQFLLMAKQHQVRGEDASALRMYRLALPHFPDNEKLTARMLALQEKLKGSGGRPASSLSAGASPQSMQGVRKRERLFTTEEDNEDSEYHDELAAADDAEEGECSGATRARQRATRKRIRLGVIHDVNDTGGGQMTPRTTHLLRVINTRDIAQIRGLKGVGVRKAETIVNGLFAGEEGDIEREVRITDLEMLKGVGPKGFEAMRKGVVL